MQADFLLFRPTRQITSIDHKNTPGHFWPGGGAMGLVDVILVIPQESHVRYYAFWRSARAAEGRALA